MLDTTDNVTKNADNLTPNGELSASRKSIPPQAKADNLTPNGVLCFRKPKGITSHDVIYRLRRLFGTKQVGHTGTLDPMATGVLVCMIGRAVKASEYLTCEEKEYVAGLRLGITTDTEDTSGKILTSYEGKMPSREEVETVISHFRGEIEQVPPMYSALKVDGQKLVDLARKGREVEREARRVFVDKLEILPSDKGENEYLLLCRVSKGTYIRTLCADIGKALGTGGAMSSLCRMSSGSFGLEDSVSQEELEAMTAEERVALLKPVETLFDDCPAVHPEPFFVRLGRSGCELYQRKLHTAYPVGTRVRLYDGDCFFALGEVREYPDGSAVKPIKAFDI